MERINQRFSPLFVLHKCNCFLRAGGLIYAVNGESDDGYSAPIRGFVIDYSSKDIVNVFRPVDQVATAVGTPTNGTHTLACMLCMYEPLQVCCFQYLYVFFKREYVPVQRFCQGCTGLCAI